MMPGFLAGTPPGHPGYMEADMAKTVKVAVNQQDLLAAVRSFLAAVLSRDAIGAMLVPWQLPMKPSVMPTLVTDPALLQRADPLAPAYPMNGATLVSKLTRKASGTRMAAVMRPCEIRAFTERVKLHQGERDEVLVIGIDCLGALPNSAYAAQAGEDVSGFTQRFVQWRLTGKTGEPGDFELAPACRVCEFPVAAGADIQVALYGVDTDSHILVQSQTDIGESILSELDYPDAEIPIARKEQIDTRIADNIAARDRMFADTRSATDDLEKLTRYLAGCVNCYNCRVACPVCYCKTCVFDTDVFNHEPLQYLRWAQRKGAIKMPTDTVFYHLTRLAHMSTACVGCGQCSNACPNDIPVMELFRTASWRVQQAFGYEAGRSADEEPPMSVFREDEFQDVVGMT